MKCLQLVWLCPYSSEKMLPQNSAASEVIEVRLGGKKQEGKREEGRQTGGTVYYAHFKRKTGGLGGRVGWAVV